MSRTTGLLFLAAAFGLSACAQPDHLSYDFGRAYKATFPVQADLTRASADGLDHSLSGVEAQAIRLNVQTESTNEETGESDYTVGGGGN
jgi:hypothetical protein